MCVRGAGNVSFHVLCVRLGLCSLVGVQRPIVSDCNAMHSASLLHAAGLASYLFNSAIPFLVGYFHSRCVC